MPVLQHCLSNEGYPLPRYLLWGVWPGGEGAPDLTESLLNFTINAAALAAFSWLFSRDYQAAEKDKRMVDREEALGRLLVRMSAQQPCLPEQVPIVLLRSPH